MFAQYSPLFTSGLLSESNTPSSSRKPSLEFREKAPRGSLPVDANIDSFYETSTSTSEDDAVFLTFMPRRRRDAGNSFLSLDLAESQSLRSMSLRRKDTVTTRATTCFGRSVPTSPNLRPMPSPPPMPLSFSHFGPATQPRRTLVRHSSREGLPGAKPIPSSQLPATPPVPRRPRPSDLTLTLSACLSAGSSGDSHSLHRTTHSEPSIISPISPLMSPFERSYLAFSPPSSPPATASLQSPFEEAQSAPPNSAPPAVPLRARPSVRSTVSFRTRQVNRSAALAALEGRSPANSHSRQWSRPRNFMSMSDDEDDGDADQSENAVPPVSSTCVPPQQSLLDVLHEEEDVVVPAQGTSQKRLSASTPTSRKSRSRRGTIESLLSPLTNFIDFRDDEGTSRSWRSFVEIS
ncbi:hypothetical protein BV20DRAFT_982725 [Pilatotrama ljubarskyi]|nr:hypothetical protein BV20DRAFT_982725 [Pilatotrama ljubarskyi]